MVKNQHQWRKKELKKLYLDDNLTIEQLANIFKCGSTTIHRKIKKFNLLKNKTIIYNNINNSRKKIFMSKYGTEHYMSSSKGYTNYQNKIKAKYGVDFITQLPSTAENYRKTCLKKYGVDHTLKVKEIRNRQRKTLINHFGSFKKFREYQSIQSSLNANRNVNQILAMSYEGKFGKFKTRSKLEYNVLKELEKYNLTLEYEKDIKIKNGGVRIPDFTINNNIIIEAKYHRYAKDKPYKSKSWTSKYYHMWDNAQKQLTDMQQWCNENNCKFYIVTEINYKKVLKQLFHHLLLNL